MVINGVQFSCELSDVLAELVAQLRANNIPLISRQIYGSTHVQITCPYHADGLERRPSAGIRKSDGMFHCFACGEVHSLPEVISYCFGHKDDVLGVFGYQWLLKNFATVAVEDRKVPALDFSRDSSRVSVVPKTVVTETELESYRYYHPYMYVRGLTDPVIELFDIGYDVRTNCITFPVRDVDGNTLFVARRSVTTKFFNYPAGSEKPVYGLYELRVTNNNAQNVDVIVCESMLDALVFWTVGKCAVALNGLGDELQFKQLRELNCRKIILCTDMDEAGLSARKRLRTQLYNKLVAEYWLPEGRKDANECTREELLALREVL